MLFSFKKNPLFIPSSQVPARNFIITIFICNYAVTVVPLLYFLYKNYLVLDEIGFKFFPTLLDVNSADKFMLICCLVFTFVTGLVIQLYAQRYFLKKIYSPIDMVQSHISKLTLGNFDQPKLPIKREQYVLELIRSYNYLYGSLQTNIKRDITFLKALEENHDPKLARVLMLEKIEQLSLNPSDYTLEVSVKKTKKKSLDKDSQAA